MERKSDPQTYEQALCVIAQQHDEIERLRAHCSALAENCIKHGSDIHRLELELAASKAREEKLRGMFLTAVEFGAIPPFDLEALRKQFEALVQDDAFERDPSAVHDREEMLREALKRICVSVCHAEDRTLGERMGDINEIAKATLAALAGPAAPDRELTEITKHPGDALELARSLGAVSYTRGPLRAVTGVSLTFEQFAAFVEVVRKTSGTAVRRPASA